MKDIKIKPDGNQPKWLGICHTMGKSHSTNKLVFAYRNPEECEKEPTQYEQDLYSLDRLLNSSLFGILEDCDEGTPLKFDELSSVKTIFCCSQSITKVSPNIHMLTTASVLQLIASIPAEIGYMKNLTSLSLARNQITNLPETIGLLANLEELRLSHNLIKHLPKSIKSLVKLKELRIKKNMLEEICPEVGMLCSLEYLDVSENPLQTLPVGVFRLKHLKTVLYAGCPLLEKTDPISNQWSKFPSLKELAAQTIVSNQVEIASNTKTDLVEFLSLASQCTTCSKPIFDSYISQVTFILRNGAFIPMEHRLCKQHWKTDRERIQQLFCSNYTRPTKQVRKSLSFRKERETVDYMTSNPTLPRLLGKKRSFLERTLSSHSIF